MTLGPADPSSGIHKRWDVFKYAQDIVDQKFEDGRGYAEDAFRTAEETINKLQSLAESLENIDIEVVVDDITPPDIDDFIGTPPTAPTIEVNMPSDLEPADQLDTAVKDKLYSDITTESPAVSDTVEDYIFNRELERSLILHRDTLDNISSEWSKRGFVLPNAFLAALIAQAEIDYANKRMDVSRDVAIKNFELSDTNMKFAIQQGIAWYAQRVEVYKAKVQAEIARVELLVRKFIGEVEVYKGEAQVWSVLADTRIKRFDAQVRAALAKAELLIKDAEVDMKNLEAVNGLRIEAMKGIASVAAQMVAGALSSVSASASLHASNAAQYYYKPAEAGNALSGPYGKTEGEELYVASGTAYI